VRASNEDHKLWPYRKLEEVVGGLSGKSIAPVVTNRDSSHIGDSRV